MSFEEEFDKIIRQKAEEQKYSFEEGNWEKASAMLDTERQAAGLLNARKYYLPAVLVVAIGAVGFVALNYFNNNTSEGEVAVVSAPIQSEIKSASPPASVESKKINNPLSPNEFEKPANVVAGTENAPVKTIDIKANTNSPEISEAPKMEANLTRRKSKGNSASAGSPVAGINVGAEPPAKVDNGQNENSKSEPVSEPGAGQEVAKKNDENATGSSKNGAAVVAVNNTGGINDGDKKNNTGVSQNNGFTAAPVEIVQAERLNSVYSVLPEVISDPDLMATQFSLLKRYDEDYYKKGKRTKNHYMNAEAGTMYLLGWDAQKGKDGQGFNWFGGFNYGVYLTKKISAGIGLQAYNISNMNQPFYTGSTKQYSFGSTTSYTVITSKELIFAAVPIKINYAVNALNTIGLGFNAGYALKSKNTIDSYTTDSEKGTSHIAPVKNNNLYEGTSTTNFMLSAYYSRVLGKRFSLNAEFVYGITDLFSSPRFVKNNEKPMGVRLSIHYTLFDK
jgi:hypothetical protein